MIYTFFFYKNVVFPAQAEYSYFSADFRLKIFFFIELSLALNNFAIASAGFFVLLASFAVQRKE